jgi:hypothetical protein
MDISISRLLKFTGHTSTSSNCSGLTNSSSQWDCNCEVLTVTKNEYCSFKCHINCITIPLLTKSALSNGMEINSRLCRIWSLITSSFIPSAILLAAVLSTGTSHLSLLLTQALRLLAADWETRF